MKDLTRVYSTNLFRFCFCWQSLKKTSQPLYVFSVGRSFKLAMWFFRDPLNGQYKTKADPSSSLRRVQQKNSHSTYDFFKIMYRLSQKLQLIILAV